MLVAEDTLARRPGNGIKSVITDTVQQIEEEQIRRDDETASLPAAYPFNKSWVHTEPSDHSLLQDASGVDV